MSIHFTSVKIARTEEVSGQAIAAIAAAAMEWLERNGMRIELNQALPPSAHRFPDAEHGGSYSEMAQAFAEEWDGSSL